MGLEQRSRRENRSTRLQIALRIFFARTTNAINSSIYTKYKQYTLNIKSEITSAKIHKKNSLVPWGLELFEASGLYGWIRPDFRV